MKLFSFIFLMILVISCNPPASEETSEEQGQYSIASNEFIDLTEQSLNQMQTFEFDTWGEMLADDVEYHYPDGDEQTRTKLIGKQAVVDWWKDWSQNSGVTSMSMTNRNIIPVHASEAPETTGLTGNFALGWTTSKLIFANGNSASFRMNINLHYNSANQIDRFYTYYDRTGIIQAMGANILEESTGESEE